MSFIRNQNYFPPYESPLEDLFALNLDKYLAEGVSISKQIEVESFCGVFRLDFVASASGQRSVAFECDGKEYHDESRDEWRDALVLGATNLGAIYRFQGPALFHHMEDCLYLLAQWERHLFSDRGHANLARLASPKAITTGGNLSFSGALLMYPPDTSSGQFLTKIERHVIEAPAGCRSFLKTALKYAKSSGMTDLDKIRARYLQGIGLEKI